MTKLDTAHLERRRPVWSALSELFLDNEVRPSVFRRSGLCEIRLFGRGTRTYLAA